MTQQSPESGVPAWLVLGGLGLVLVAGLEAGLRVVDVLWKESLTLAQFVATLWQWRAQTIWRTATVIPHPLAWHLIAAGVAAGVFAVGAGLVLGGIHLVQSPASASRLLRLAPSVAGNSPNDPTHWLPFKVSNYRGFTPAAVIAKDKVRPRLEATPPEERRVEDYGFVMGYARGSFRHPIAISAELSVLVAGEPRSGKTAGFVIPWVSGWQGPVVTTSTRNEVLRATLLARRRVSEHVYVLALPGTPIPAGVQPISYDISWFYKPELQTLIESAERRAAIFSEIAGDKGQPIWESASKQVFACLLLIAFAWRHAQVRWLGADPGSSKPELDGIRPHTNHIDVLKRFATLRWTQSDAAVGRVGDFLAANIPGGKGAYARAYLNSVVRTFQGSSGRTEFAQTISGMIAVGLGKLNDPQVAAVFSTPWNEPVFDPEEFLAQSGTLYLISRSEDSNDLAKFFSLVVNEVAAAARRRAGSSGRCDPGLALILDEVANIAPLPNLKGYMSEGGGTGITTVAVVQNIRQLMTIYGDAKGKEIVSSANVLATFGGAKAKEDLEIFADLAGTHAVRMSSFDDRGKVTGKSESMQAAIDPNQIGNMPAGWIYLKLPGVQPIMVKTVNCWMPPGLRRERNPIAARRARRESGGPFAGGATRYPFHKTARALSWRATYDLAIASTAAELEPLQVEVPLDPNASFSSPAAGHAGQTVTAPRAAQFATGMSPASRRNQLSRETLGNLGEDFLECPQPDEIARLFDTKPEAES